MDRDVIFFCGATLNHKGLLKYKGETPAASLWIKGLLTGLMDNNVEVLGFAPVWDSLFPKGYLLPGDKNSLEPTIPQKLVKYLNIPYLREKSVAFSLERSIEKEIKSGNIPKAILNYNTYPYYCRALKKIAKKYPNIPWVNVVLDLDDPTVDNWKRFLNDTKGSFGSVFLSWWGFSGAPINEKLHLDGGWTGELPNPIYPPKKVFLYAGKYSKYGGIQDIVDAIKLIQDREVVFKFYGKGNYEPLQQLAKNDTRVQIKGFVSEEELDVACKNAYAFLAPREVDFQGTRMIFPSKILFYLKYQKPIISPKIPGLSPDYESVLIILKENTVNNFVYEINKAINFTEVQLNEVVEKSKKLLALKSWNMQARNLLNFLKNI